MAEFVRAQIFGTTFEITSRYRYTIPAPTPFSAQSRPALPEMIEVERANTDALVGIRTCNPWAWERLAWSGKLHLSSQKRLKDIHNREKLGLIPVQFGKGSAHRTSGGREEDYEALQHACPVQANLS